MVQGIINRVTSLLTRLHVHVHTCACAYIVHGVRVLLKARASSSNLGRLPYSFSPTLSSSPFSSPLSLSLPLSLHVFLKSLQIHSITSRSRHPTVSGTVGGTSRQNRPSYFNRDSVTNKEVSATHYREYTLLLLMVGGPYFVP